MKKNWEENKKRAQSIGSEAVLLYCLQHRFHKKERERRNPCSFSNWHYVFRRKHMVRRWFTQSVGSRWLITCHAHLDAQPKAWHTKLGNTLKRIINHSNRIERIHWLNLPYNHMNFKDHQRNQTNRAGTSSGTLSARQIFQKDFQKSIYSIRLDTK